MATETAAHVAQPIPVGIRPASGYQPRLEALRGVAVVLVMLSHVDGMIRPAASLDGVRVSPISAFVHSGHTGVTLFFVLSAFLLSRPFLRAAREPGRPSVSVARFAARRAMRILPLYWAVVVAASVLHAIEQAGSPWIGLPYLVFLNSSAKWAEPIHGYSEVWWSLATEAQFYLVLPLVGLLLRSRPGRWTVAAGLGAYAGAYAIEADRGFRVLVSMESFSLFGRLPAFAIGMGAAWIHDVHGEAIRRRLERSPWMRRGGADGLLAGVVLALGSLLAEVSYRGYFTAERLWHAWHVGESFLWAVIVLLVLIAPVRSGRLLDGRVLIGVGVLSYSLYLVHLPVFLHVIPDLRERVPALYTGWNPTSLSVGLACIALAIAIAAVTYFAVERPFLRRKARIGD